MHRSWMTVAPTVTDNRGNGASLNKLMTSKYTPSAILMEMSAYMKRMGIQALVGWSPREGNREADALANGCYDGFNPALRIPVDARSMKREVPPQALEWGREAEDMLQTTKKEGGLLQRNVKLRKLRVDTRLRITDPW